MRTITCLVLTTLSITACAGGAVDDELAEETALDGDAGKADSVDAFTFYMVTPDPRQCSLGARCGGFFVARANRSTTVCGGGAGQSLCYVDRIDWTGTRMAASITSGYEDRLRQEEPFLIRGSVEAIEVGSGGRAGTALAATEIWVAGSPDGVIEGVFTKIRSCSARPGHPPCGSAMDELKINSNVAVKVAAIDFAVSGASAAAITRAKDSLREGVIVVGDRYTPSTGGKGRTANQFFTRVPVRPGNPSCLPGATCN